MSAIKDRVARQVERIEVSYAQTKHTLESKAHSCTWDAQGRCLYCPNRATLGANLRTGELK